VPVVPATGPLAGKTAYSNSFALLIGLNEYARLPRDAWLHHAVDDVSAMREMLIGHYGFASESVFVLTDQQATLENIRRVLSFLADRRAVQAEDRVLVYFSGHGQTVKLANGGEMGFLIPYDAAVDVSNGDNAGPYLATCLAMKSVWEYVESSPAKHVLLIADACYSGLLTRPSAVTGDAGGGVAANLSRRAVQVITAGLRGDSAYEDPKLGHGAFTYKLLEELKARAATPDVPFTATTLFGLLKPSVSALSEGKMTPQMGNYDSDGDFVFIPGPAITPLKPPARPVAAQPAAAPPAGTQPAPAGQPAGAETGAAGQPALPVRQAPNGHWYEAVAVPAGIRWFASLQAAQGRTFQGMKGHLVTITSVAESQFVIASFPEALGGSYWTGGYQDKRAPDYREPDGGWRWVTGEPWGFTQWNRGLAQEPNNAPPGEEDCISLASSGAWNDMREDSRTGGYLVEYEPAPGR
jgi:hypothetical protein